MNRILIALSAVTVSLTAVPARACIPPPRDTAQAIALAPAAFIARVDAVEQLPVADCQRELRSQGGRPGDLGWSSCDAYGVAHLSLIRVIRGEAPIPENLTAPWTAQAFCYLGWRPQVGTLVLALLPPTGARLHDNTNVYVDPFDQNNAEVRRLLGSVSVP